MTGQYSRLGALMDPLIDRLVVIVGVAVVWNFELLPRWALAVLVAREADAGVRAGALRLGLDLHINWLGRISVWFTMGAVGAALLGWESAKEPFSVHRSCGFAGRECAIHPRRRPAAEPLRKSRSVKAVVMAGGEGTRLRPLTSNQPKPMVPVAGKPCMEHILELVRRHGAGRARGCAPCRASRDGHHRLGLVGGERAQPGALAACHHDGLHDVKSRSRVGSAALGGSTASRAAARGRRRARTARWRPATRRARRRAAPRRARPSRTGRSRTAPMVGQTAIRPTQLIWRSRPEPQAAAAPATTISSSRATSAASAQRGSSSKFQVTITPASTTSRSISGSISAPSRLYWPVSAGEQAVEVVAPGRDAKQAVASGTRPSSEDKATTTNAASSAQAHVADEVRQRERAQRLRPRGSPAARGRRGRRPEGARLAACAAIRAARRAGLRRAPAAPSIGTVRFSMPRRTCTSSSPDSRRALAGHHPQRAAEQLGLHELLARA